MNVTEAAVDTSNLNRQLKDATNHQITMAQPSRKSMEATMVEQLTDEQDSKEDYVNAATSALNKSVSHVRSNSKTDLK